MKRFQYITLLTFVSILALWTTPMAKDESKNDSSSAICRQGSCSDPWADCKRKVEVVSRKGECVTFRCETGTKNEHLVKTNNEEAKKNLFAMIDRPKPDSNLNINKPQVSPRNGPEALPSMSAHAGDRPEEKRPRTKN